MSQLHQRGAASSPESISEFNLLTSKDVAHNQGMRSGRESLQNNTYGEMMNN